MQPRPESPHRQLVDLRSQHGRRLHVRSFDRYREEDFYRQHPTFTFDTLYESGTWQVVAALDTTLGADPLPYYTFFDAHTKLEWEKRVNAILDLSLYDTGVVPEYGQQLLTLSTCGDTRLNTDTRFALLAVRVED